MFFNLFFHRLGTITRRSCASPKVYRISQLLIHHVMDFLNFRRKTNVTKMYTKVRFYGKQHTLSEGRKWTLKQACVLNTRIHKVEYAPSNAVKLCTVQHI